HTSANIPATDLHIKFRSDVGKLRLHIGYPYSFLGRWRHRPTCYLANFLIVKRNQRVICPRYPLIKKLKSDKFYWSPSFGLLKGRSPQKITFLHFDNPSQARSPDICFIC